MAKTHKKYMIVGNWKMNPDTLLGAKALFNGISRSAAKHPEVTVVIAAPAPFISLIGSKKTSLVLAAAQDIAVEERGAFTGSVSATQVQTVGASHVLIGHSERRGAGDTDAIVATKVNRALNAGLKVILCIGEKERDEQAQYLRIIREQILTVFSAVSDKKKLRDIVIAYEPVWAIGKSFSVAPKPNDIHEMSLYIRKVVIEMLGKTDGMKLSVLYGGAVNSENAEAMLRDGGIQGLLVGRQSLDVEAFSSIIEYADRV